MRGSILDKTRAVPSPLGKDLTASISEDQCHPIRGDELGFIRSSRERNENAHYSVEAIEGLAHVGAKGKAVTAGLGEPALPAFYSAGLDISPHDLNRVKERATAVGLTIRGYRFEGDRLCKPERFATLREVLGPAFIGNIIPDNAANPNGLKANGRPPHSVFTTDLIDEAAQPTREAVNEIIAFFQQVLKPL